MSNAKTVYFEHNTPLRITAQERSRFPACAGSAPIVPYGGAVNFAIEELNVRSLRGFYQKEVRAFLFVEHYMLTHS